MANVSRRDFLKLAGAAGVALAVSAPPDVANRFEKQIMDETALIVQNEKAHGLIANWSFDRE